MQPRITLEQWQALVAVVEAGSHARAAERLHKTQSTVTYAIRRIESLLGVKAFELQGRRAAVTPTGQLLYRRAKVLLDEASEAEAAARRISAGWEAEIRIAMEHIFPAPLMFECLDSFNRETPHTRIELFETVLGGTAEALVSGQVDLAVTSHVPAGFLGESLLRMRLFAVAHPDHPLHHLGRAITLQDLRLHRHLVVRESGSLRNTRPSVEAVQRWTLSHMAASITAARMGYGYGWAPEDKIREELASGSLKPLPLREGAERFGELYLVLANAEDAGPGVLRLAQIVKEAVRKSCATPVGREQAKDDLRREQLRAARSAASDARRSSAARKRRAPPRQPSS